MHERKKKSKVGHVSKIAEQAQISTSVKSKNFVHICMEEKNQIAEQAQISNSVL